MGYRAAVVTAVLAALAGGAVLGSSQDSPKEKLKAALKDNDPVGEWFYDDFPGALSQARKSGKPLLVVLRCVPTWLCREIDRPVARRETPGMADLLNRFVCVRLVQAYGLDLNLFQFDPDLVWAVFFMNADKAIYGRYGTRGRGKDPHKDVSLEGFKKAAEGALELHQAYPANRKDLEGKTGPEPEWRIPQIMPDLKGKEENQPADGKSCLRCHHLHEGELWSLRSKKHPVPERMLWPYPMPEAVGLLLDPKERATVTAVAPGSAAEKAGFKEGDRILRLEGQPLLSVADVQWVLHQAGEKAKLRAEVDRGGGKEELTLVLAPGWRQKSDPGWRATFRNLRLRLAGPDAFEEVPLDVRREQGLPPTGMALRVKSVTTGGSQARNTSFSWKKNDVVIAVDGRNDLDTEVEFLAHLLRKTPGQKASLTVLREGKALGGTLIVP